MCMGVHKIYIYLYISVYLHIYFVYICISLYYMKCVAGKPFCCARISFLPEVGVSIYLCTEVCVACGVCRHFAVCSTFSGVGPCAYLYYLHSMYTFACCLLSVHIMTNGRGDFGKANITYWCTCTRKDTETQSRKENYESPKQRSGVTT